MKKLIEKLKAKTTAKNSFLTLCSNLISQLMSFLVTVLLGRSLSVADYGLYSILNSIATFVSDMADMGMNGAITRFVAEYRAKKDLASEEQLITYAIKRKFRNLIFVFIVLVLAAKPIATFWLKDTQSYPYVYLISLTCAFSLFVGAMRAIIQGRQEYEKYFISVVSWNFVWCAVIVIMFLTNKMTIAASIIAGAVSGLVNLILCTKLIGYNPKNAVRKSSISPDVKSKFNTFGNWMVIWSVFALLQSRADIFLLATFTTPEQVSYYDIASKLIKPVLMVVSAYAQVLNPQFASMDTREKLNKQIASVIKFIAVISALIGVAIVVVGPAVKLVFGNKYNDAIFPAQLLLFAIIFYVWTVPFNSALYAINKPEVFAFAALLGLIVTVVGDIFLLPSLGAVGAAITYIAAQVVGLVVAFVAYKLLYRKETLND
ncbi:MAG: flippase [Oscillospiraceae bacterium]|nr:flippase [Oscillospiraceae bacterium]